LPPGCTESHALERGSGRHGGASGHDDPGDPDRTDEHFTEADEHRADEHRADEHRADEHRAAHWQCPNPVRSL
jgi:hypothetical protein